MKTIKFQKVVMVFDGEHIPFDIKYSQLENEIANDTEVEFYYSQGMKTRREKLLTKLGFTLKQAIWTPNPDKDPIWAEYRGIWTRKAGCA